MKDIKAIIDTSVFISCLLRSPSCHLILIARDKDLLALELSYKGISIISPEEFLRLIT